MSERWKRELSKVDELDPSSGLFERAKSNAKRSRRTRRPDSRTKVVLVVGGLLLIAGAIVVRAFGFSAPTQPTVPDQGASVAEISCGADGVEVLSPTVDATSAGVAFSFSNPGGAASVMLQGSGHDNDLTVILNKGTRQIQADVAPGEYQVACEYPEGHPNATPELVTTIDFLTVADPLNLWTPSELTCEDKQRQVVLITTEDLDTPPPQFDAVAFVATTDVSVEQLIRYSVPGFLDTDEIVVAGYGASSDNETVFTRTLLRNGVPIANLRFLRVHEEAIHSDQLVCVDAGLIDPRTRK